MKADLHLVSWNRPKMTELVIKTIHNNTDRDHFRLIVLDNASEEPTVKMLESLEKQGFIDELVLLKTNIGLESARNLLLNNFTQSDYFVCVDNDCLPPPRKGKKDWLTQMLDLIKKHDYGAIAMRTQVMIGTGNIFEGIEEDIVDFPHPGGSYRIMNTGITYFVGGWDRGSTGRGQEERYIGQKLHDAGFNTAFATNIQCLHLFGDRKQTAERWGYDEKLKPEDTGHSDVCHPALQQGDIVEEVLEYAFEEDVERYFDVNNNY